MKEMSVYKFPENFKWGSATSAHQIEGGNHNDWSEWELKRAKGEAEKAKLRKWPESILKGYPNPLQEENYISGKACDSYNRYEEDFDIAKQLNQNIHRFSIEWSRIEPEEGRFDEKEMQHYVNVVKSLRDRGIEPMITLWHFTNPVWFAQKGGFLNLDSPKYFTRYASYVVKHLPEVRLWITFNEATDVYSSHAYFLRKWPPQHRSIFEWSRVNKNIIKAHIEAYKEIKRIYNSPSSLNNQNNPDSTNSNSGTQPGDMSHNVEVGIAVRNTWSVGGNNFYEKIIGKLYNYYRNLYFWTKAFPYYDFMGLNYYEIDRRVPGSYKKLPKQDWWMKDMGWELYPKGIYYALKQLTKFKKPIFITENGFSGPDDERQRYVEEHLKWVWEAIHDGANIFGYTYWSLLDNFEWDHGYGPKFGLVEVDYKTFERHIRPSAHEYAKICKENQLEID